MNIELILAILGSLGTAVKWVYEYSKKLKWEKNKFLLSELEIFHELESTKLMEKMLDWNKIKLTINNRDVVVSDELLFEAFQTHNLKHSFTPDEVALRGIFDDYFDNLTKLIFMCKSDLIEKENLIMFMEYWFKILSGHKTSKKRSLVDQMHKYLDFYGFTTLRNFINTEIS